MPGHENSALEPLLLRHRYKTLLAALLVILVVFPLLQAAIASRFLLDALLSVLFLAALQAIFATKPLRALGFLLGVPALLGIWTDYVLPGAPLLEIKLGFHLIAALFLAFSVGVILSGIVGDRKVAPDSVYGAFCAYLLVGLAFGHLFTALELTAPGSYGGMADAQELLRNVRERHYALTYISFTTLTCMGYSDLAPRSGAARGLAVVESVCGQFFIAVLIAELIGKRVAQALASPPPPDAPG